MINIMLDLETLATTSNAVIWCLGAVRFDSNGLHDEIRIDIDPDSCEGFGLVKCPETVEWWATQSPEARAGMERPGMSLPVALEHFTRWVNAQGSSDETLVWGKGACFDCVIATNAYRAIGAVEPWRYYNQRCYRTIAKICPEVPFHPPKTPHDPLEDAVAQAEHLIECYLAMGKIDQIAP